MLCGKSRIRRVLAGQILWIRCRLIHSGRRRTSGCLGCTGFCIWAGSGHGFEVHHVHRVCSRIAASATPSHLRKPCRSSQSTPALLPSELSLCRGTHPPPDGRALGSPPSPARPQRAAGPWQACPSVYRVPNPVRRVTGRPEMILISQRAETPRQYAPLRRRAQNATGSGL